MVMSTLHFKEQLPACNPVVDFQQGTDKLLLLDFTDANNSLTEEIIDDTRLFSRYIGRLLKEAGARYGIGGYNEHRTVYSRSSVFDAAEGEDEPRRLHLGIDIWGAAGSTVYTPLTGTVHSFAFNNHFGDYGATIILRHELPGIVFHSLYGHLSLNDLDGLEEGQTKTAGTVLAHFGEPQENGHWPPHLHFQLIFDMEGNKGDYPGVCRYSEREKYLSNCPDPDLVLGMMQYAKGS
ncbi:MAG: peptidoglycan DD-metalloendopeptidase family protein [Chitinophagaceae bacterium]|nr:peptidoglycan DD-metalloendopeptidase family protein [Chitinophagaceae bacterium]